MKVAVFENQYHQVEIQFEVANRIYFNDSLDFDQFNSSQDLSPLSKIANYDLVIVDISLSSNSDMDGYNLITEIIKVENHPKILIMTGNSNVEERLLRIGLDSIPILVKPIDPKDIRDKINSL